MAGYQENLKEQKSRFEYRRGYIVILSFAIFFLTYVLTNMLLSEESIALFNIPFTNAGDIDFYIFATAIILPLRWWWYGIPKYVPKFIKNNKFVSKGIREGKCKELENFFFQPVVMSDELPRVSQFKYFKSKKYQIGNFFDFDPVTKTRKDNGTDEIISLFRDATRERIIKLTKSKNPEKAKKAKLRLEGYKKAHGEFGDGKPSLDQISLYTDLFQIIEGMIHTYTSEYDEIKIQKIKSPLVLKVNKNKEVVDFYVDETRDIYKDGKISLSIDMILDTVNNLSILFENFLVKQEGRQSRISHRFSRELTDKKKRKRIQAYFKFVMLRKLLSSYGSLPSGWFVVKIEDYTLRAIISTIDRELIPAITKNNDGSNDIFHSDVFASNFLFLYLSFLKNKEMEKIFGDIEWCFNATKNVNEIQVRAYAQENASKIVVENEEDDEKNENSSTENKKEEETA